MSDTKSTVAKLLVKCLEAEGVEYVFGIPGEENIRLIDAMADSSIRFILVRHEQGASFMADMYGRLTGKAGVCTATLGPGAINLLLGVADAQTDSTPMVAISAQVGLNRIYKESHQYIDLQGMFAPVTKWSDTILTPASVPEMMRKAFDLAQRERPGAVYLAVPQDLEESDVSADLKPITVHPVHTTAPDPDQVAATIDLIKKAKQPIILAGHGVARSHASKQLIELSELLNVPVATTFMAKGVIPDRHPNALGVAGFMRRDYENFAFDAADVILSVGYELQEFAPSKINPNHDKKIVHIHHFAEDIDAAYPVAIAIEADIDKSLDALIDGLKKTTFPKFDNHAKIKQIKKEELDGNADDQSFPLKPQRIISDIRKAMGDDDIVLADTGAIKMWMARLYPTQKPSTCLISNGLSTMAFALPGALAAKLACPDRKVLAVMGDGSFLMNSQEIETAIRENIPLVVLIWVDDAYGLIKWKMDLEIKHHRDVDFTNPDFVQYAESFGAKGYEIKSADMLLPVIEKALADDGVSIIACPVDYAENNKLTDKLGDLTITI
ncbi:acetolactate synthase large subunit [Zymomonas mobilis subsp. mobilis ZM4 = ATCC 31821]|uniref:Thiamine pyrophosphate protein TPP binding domain protein n=2 Tax=Zymomonas mobilis subsp. mobilis TaxID=120045 RepID=Q5NPP9_ZYMMO|nr:acetolactate synthase large subunit [Zymomonas mobilis]AAV89311.1 thiamine pyrophosphate protein TPP binding domain protein [Zymomonas mobilis subsp. mobilis ZM4 = ATCC 31821]ACV75128.1 thiamine pyrophosphate protein TPP binding domain protein [Zymomonas mobilis subsp. mobilis NCIMB 11163]AEH62438.1 thiamine pyrophosphate protein TPP binding domain protein [Zymomonas mobilis subsp. mobilis ATCC 10988]AHB09916.1 acetolactate synthase, large subunit [Zymomonas mobilis subsp. mobilis str. CP4 =